MQKNIYESLNVILTVFLVHYEKCRFDIFLLLYFYILHKYQYTSIKGSKQILTSNKQEKMIKNSSRPFSYHGHVKKWHEIYL